MLIGSSLNTELLKKKQAEAEVVPSSSLVEVGVFLCYRIFIGDFDI